jgi:hypothetical protein
MAAQATIAVTANQGRFVIADARPIGVLVNIPICKQFQFGTFRHFTLEICRFFLNLQPQQG